MDQRSFPATNDCAVTTTCHLRIVVAHLLLLLWGHEYLLALALIVAHQVGAFIKGLLLLLWIGCESLLLESGRRS